MGQPLSVKSPSTKHSHEADTYHLWQATVLAFLRRRSRSITVLTQSLRTHEMEKHEKRTPRT